MGDSCGKYVRNSCTVKPLSNFFIIDMDEAQKQERIFFDIVDVVAQNKNFQSKKVLRSRFGGNCTALFTNILLESFIFEMIGGI